MKIGTVVPGAKIVCQLQTISHAIWPVTTLILLPNTLGIEKLLCVLFYISQYPNTII